MDTQTNTLKVIDERDVKNGSIIVIDTGKEIECRFLNKEQLKVFNRNLKEDVLKILELKNTINYN